jgi:hypothetical protein
MVQTLTARTVTLRDLIEQLGLQLVADPTVFLEGQCSDSGTVGLVGAQGAILGAGD